MNRTNAKWGKCMRDDIRGRKGEKLPDELRHSVHRCRRLHRNIHSHDFTQDSRNKPTSSSTVAWPLERSLRVPLPVPTLGSLAGLAPFDRGSSISVVQIENKTKCHRVRFHHRCIYSCEIARYNATVFWDGSSNNFYALCWKNKV